MRDDILHVLRRDGIITRARLIAMGLSDRDIRSALMRGELHRLRQGVFGSPDLSPDLAAAIAAGGRSACTTELRQLGVWVSSPGSLHVHLAAHASKPRRSERATRHWAPLLRTPSPTSVDPLDAVRQASTCLAGPDLVATIDSALRAGFIERCDLLGLSTAVDTVLPLIDPRAQSGLESLVRVALRELGLRVEPQAEIPGIGAVDLLVEGRVVVELDGATHLVAGQRRRDIDRDAVAIASGYLPLRFDHAQVMSRRDLVCRAVVNAVRFHRGVRSSGRTTAVAQRRLDTRGIT